MMRCDGAILQRRLRERYRSTEAICRYCKQKKDFLTVQPSFFRILRSLYINRT